MEKRFVEEQRLRHIKEEERRKAEQEKMEAAKASQANRKVLINKYDSQAVNNSGKQKGFDINIILFLRQNTHRQIHSPDEASSHQILCLR